VTVAAGEPSTFVISLTPFAEDESLDEGALRAHLRRMAEAGIGVYLAGSGSGEGYTLSGDELRRVLEIGAEELAGRVPVRAMGVEPRSASQMVELGRLARDAGVEAMQVYSLDQGHGNRPRPDELERYLRDVLDEAPLPVVLSSHQAAGYHLAPELVGRLVGDYDSIIGINATNTDVTYLVDLLAAVEGRVDVHVGGPMQATLALALGAQGYLSSDGNLAPRLCVSVIDRHRAGDLAGRDDAYRTLMQLFTVTRRHGGISATKAGLAGLGLPGGRPRRPRLPVSADAAAAMTEALHRLGIPALESIA
jgi:4-hydroxy-tetrahydrodipicolinate synthase